MHTQFLVQILVFLELCTAELQWKTTRVFLEPPGEPLQLSLIFLSPEDPVLQKDNEPSPAPGNSGWGSLS